MHPFGVTGVPSGHGGGGGEVAVVYKFTNNYTFNGVSLTGMGFGSTAFIRYDAGGNVKQAMTLDATGFCEMRDAIVDGDSTIVAGLTIGTTAVPAYGACSIATNRQDPVAIRIAADGTQSVLAHWSATGANAQTWAAAQLSDGSLFMSGVYGADLSIGSPLPTALTDPNGWVARTHPTIPTNGAWFWGNPNSGVVHAGPVAASGTGTCAMGAFSMGATLFGVPLGNVGGYDTWVAHLSANGGADFVIAVGSTNNESNFQGESGIAALPDNGCAIAIIAPDDVTYDGTTFPVSQGLGLTLELANNGALVRGSRYPDEPTIAAIGARRFVAYGVSAPIMIGGQLYTPALSDVVIVELGGNTMPDRLIGVVGGAGSQTPHDLFEVAPDALGIVVHTTGPLVFGDSSFDSAGSDVLAVGVIGL
jgi:hypothetical protein